ncbi:MAG: hypothetical protein FWC83_01535, partial [Alphaproteobacteria bacterium]|nr:hypothetical protein [Alphaproteobacteria bacterium]
MARKKKKFSKKRMIVLMSLRGLLLLFIGFSVSVIIAISQIDPDNFRKDITDGLSSAIGMPVEIDGDLSWRLSLRPRAEMTSVVVRNSDWAQNEYGINISSISVVLDPFALITRRPAMREIRLVNPIIYIEENESGDMSMSASVNQRYRVAEYNGSGAPEQFPFNINLGFEVLEIINLQITHITPNATEVYSFDRMRIRARNLPHAQELDGFVQSGGSEYKFAARFSELDTERRIFPVRIAIADRGAPLVINAALEAASRIPIDFTINGTIIDFQRMARIANLDIPEIPRFDINMRGGFGHSELKIHRGSLRVGTNDINITGEFNWSSGRTPTINATIAGNNINLMQVMPDLYRPSSVAWERPDRDLHVFKDVPLHAHLLRMANINLVLDIRNLIVYRELAVRYIDARATLYDGHLTARANAEMGGGGDIDAKVIGFEQDGRIFATAGGRGRNIIVGDLLTELRTHNFMTGLPSSFDVYLESNGAELSELMANLNGQVRGWTTGRGRALRDLTDYLYGRDLLTTVRSGVESVVRRGNTDITHVNCA